MDNYTDSQMIEFRKVVFQSDIELLFTLMMCMLLQIATIKFFADEKLFYFAVAILSFFTAKKALKCKKIITLLAPPCRIKKYCLALQSLFSQ